MLLNHDRSRGSLLHVHSQEACTSCFLDSVNLTSCSFFWNGRTDIFYMPLNVYCCSQSSLLLYDTEIRAEKFLDHNSVFGHSRGIYSNRRIVSLVKLLNYSHCVLKGVLLYLLLHFLTVALNNQNSFLFAPKTGCGIVTPHRTLDHANLFSHDQRVSVLGRIVKCLA